MRSDQAPTIRLSEYSPPTYLVETVHLTFRLDPSATEVVSKLRLTPNTGDSDLLLDGEDLELLSLEIDDVKVQARAIKQTNSGISIARSALPDGTFELACTTRINPSKNTALEGLYISKGMYCTQCEAEGFRKITYFPDRPDVMAVYTVRIEGDEPVLLSNGNLSGTGPGWAEWHDPWPKPSYLFALVAGDLAVHEDTYATASGRDVALRIYVRPGDEEKCGYAMDALKRSMAWDEKNYGREYDLDIFMIVAVDDFNMGAMENKGLNVFNSKYVLASPETATDRDYELIEGIIAHEYFHNWTGNRITCRDWFQLCLKEGLTVYRDQQFSGDQRSRSVTRIDNVKMLRARQFREDAGPLAHPVRPEEYIEINNFYTATVYEKGAELIRMLRTLVGNDNYDRALDLYFERHDGQACTIEDWIRVFEDTTAVDLSHFKLWYSQAGTPHVTATDAWDGSTYSLTLRQNTPPTPGQADKKPLVIPVAVGLLDPSGHEVKATRIFKLDKTIETFTFDGLQARPIPSMFRGFSAPVIVDRKVSNSERAFLLAHDTDPFNKWEAGREYAIDLLTAMALEPKREVDPGFLAAMAAVLKDAQLDPAFRALVLTLPSIEDVMSGIRDETGTSDPDAAFSALERLDISLATALQPRLMDLYDKLQVDGAYTPNAEASGRRSLRGRLLGLITRLEEKADTAQRQFETADNMTEKMQALPLLIRRGQAEEALERFYTTWSKDQLVIDKWFSVQAMATAPDAASDVVEELTSHPDFDWKNPNRFRSLLGVFASANIAGFHRKDGAGYSLLTDWLLKLDPINPQTTARLAGVFETWRDYDETRQTLMLSQLQRLSDLPNLSKDTGEIVGRVLEERV